MPISDNSPIKIVNETPDHTPTFINEEKLSSRQIGARNSERISDQRQDCMITDLSKESINNESPPIPVNFARPINDRSNIFNKKQINSVKNLLSERNGNRLPYDQYNQPGTEQSRNQTQSESNNDMT